MDVFSLMKPAKIADIEPGTCIMVGLKDQAYFGMITVPVDGQGTIVLFKPLSFDEKPFGPMGLIIGGIAEGAPIWEISGAKTVASYGDVRFGHRVPAGALIQAEDRLVFSASLDEKRTQRFDLVTGKVVRGEYGPALWYPTWSIVAPDAAGELRTVCKVTAAGHFETTP